MEATLNLWAVIFAVGALNYLSRLSFIVFFARRSMPAAIARALRYVPAAMLTALVVPMVVDPGAIDASASKVVAAIIATVVAYFKLGTLWTLVVGMAAVWILQLLLT